LAVTCDVYLEAGDSALDLFICDGVAVTICDPGTLSSDTQYYWQVVIEDAYGAISPGEVWRNTLTTEPGASRWGGEQFFTW
jgi:hypothetical protein